MFFSLTALIALLFAAYIGWVAAADAKALPKTDYGALAHDGLVLAGALAAIVTALRGARVMRAALIAVVAAVFALPANALPVSCKAIQSYAKGLSAAAVEALMDQYRLSPRERDEVRSCLRRK